MSDVNYWIAATYLSGIGAVRIRRWLQHFSSIQQLMTATPKELQAIGLSQKNIEAFQSIPWKLVEKDYQWCEQNHCETITLDDVRYPVLLREMQDAPLLLYVQGDGNLLSQSQLAMVGTRHPTKTGMEIADKFAYCLAKAGLVITSGMALGIDAASHQGALRGDGKTIAVAGTGLQHIYPASHRELAKKIIATGALVSEFPPSAGAKREHFPMRNRVISGMSLGVLVVEAAVKSGSLITAHFALEQNREVFAIPGSIHNPVARGCHHLIRQGAKLVESAEDILVELGALHAVVEEEKNTKKDKNDPVLASIGYEITPLDVICRRVRLTVEEVSSLLLTLELEGKILLQAGGYIRIA